MSNRVRFKRRMRKHKPNWYKAVNKIMYEMWIGEVNNILYAESPILTRLRKK